MILGVVGKIGSGKSEAIKYFQDKCDAISFSCDDIAKEIIKEKCVEVYSENKIFTNKNLQEQIRIEFHPLVFRRIIESLNNFSIFFEEIQDNLGISSNINSDITNFLNKNNLYSNFNFKNLKNYLNNKNTMNFNNLSNKNNFLNECKLLFTIESALPSEDMFKICDKMVCIDSLCEVRSRRLKDSRGYSEDKIKQIYDSQEYYEKFYNRADFKIDNNGTKEEFINKLEEVVNEIYITGK